MLSLLILNNFMGQEKEQSLSFKDWLAVAGQLSLVNLAENRELTEKGRQGILGDIWKILLVLYPEDREGEVQLTVPSERLIELGLVSEQIAEKISGRKKRRKALVVNPQNEPLNIITISKTDSGFKISKTYMAEEQFLTEGESLLRRDTLMREEAFLEKNESDGRFNFRMKAGKSGVHLHAFGQIWVMKETEKEDLRVAQISSKDLIRTLVLLIEGISSGCLNPPKKTSIF